MKKHKLVFSLLLLLVGRILFAQPLSPLVIRAYVEKYKDVAMAEMKRTGIPASITLAQGILETEAGTSPLVLASNNHFGIKCKSTWTGESVRHDDDAKGECFRKYASAADSYKDHSDFLLSGSRYAFLFRIDPTDYESWAYGLKKAGYATNPRYPQILIKYIRDYQLQDYTLIAMGRKSPEADPNLAQLNTAADAQQVVATVVPAAAAVTTVAEVKKPVYPEGVFKINETSVVFVSKGTSFLAVADQHRLRLSRLFDFNDMPAQDVAAEDMLVYLQRKRKTGANETHTVAPGETLYGIAQTEGIRLESLLGYNYLKADMIPQVGEVLQLHHKASSMPRLAATAVTVVSSSSDMAKADVVMSAPVRVATVTASAPVPASQESFIYHVVQPKETMYSISKRYSVTMDDVMKWNDLQGTDLKTGQQLRIKRM